jgi:hypothetical protein
MKGLNERPSSLKHVMMFKGGKVDELHGQIQPNLNLFETPTFKANLNLFETLFFKQTSISLKPQLSTKPRSL